MVTVDALKLLYKKLGGTADVEDITAISDMVDLIEDVAGGGGGGASGLVVRILWTEDTPILDKTYAEIAECLDNGINPVVVSVDDEDSTMTDMSYSIFGYGQSDGKYMVEMQSVEAGYEVPYPALIQEYFISETADGVLTRFE